MTSGLVWSGLAEFKTYLRDLPLALRDDARTIVIESGEQAETSVVQAYPRGRTGNLRGGVQRQERSAGLRLVVFLRNRAPHTHIYEKGTVGRRTKKGWWRGVMPAGRVWIPTMIRVRTGMYAALKQLVLDHGAASVHGDA